MIAETVPKLPGDGSREESLIVVELSFVAQQAVETGGDAALVMGLTDEENIGQLADPLGSRFEQLGHMARAAGHGVEQHQPAVRARVGGHHERTEFAAVETQELRSRQAKRMSERRRHREVGIDELWNVDDRNVGDLSSSQHLASEVILAVVFPAVDPRAPVLRRSELQGGVMLVGLWQVLRPVFEEGEFALGVAAVQADREASLA